MLPAIPIGALVGANVRFGWKADIDERLGLFDPSTMIRMILSLSLFCAACGFNEQPTWTKTVAAYEVPLPTAADKARFTRLLVKEAEAEGYHVDVATPHELANQPISFNASVWRGVDDEESMASAMDFQDRIGRVWIGFPLGQNPQLSARFRDKLVPNIKREWPNTASLPIMPNGAIPLTEDLVRAPKGYVVKPSAAAKYAEGR